MLWRSVCLSVSLAKCHLPWSFLESSPRSRGPVGHSAPHFAAAAASGGMRNAGMEWNGFRGSYIHDIRRLYERVPSGRASQWMIIGPYFQNNSSQEHFEAVEASQHRLLRPLSS